MADPNATGAKTGTDGAAAENADYVTKAEFETLNATLANIAATLKGIPNTVNKAAQDQLGRQLKALGLTPETLAKLTAAPKTDGEGGEDAEAEAEREAQAEAKRAAKKQPKTETQTQDKGVDIEALLKKQAAEMEANWAKRFKAIEESTKTKLADAEKKREAAERAQVELRGTTAARAALSKHVVPDSADLAFDALVARKHLHIAEDGTPYYRSNPADEDSQVPFADGVPEFLKTPGAKVFVPAPAAKPGTKPNTSIRPLPASGANGAQPVNNPAAIDAGVRARTGMDLGTLLLTPGYQLPATSE